jgi:hypothetical protein
MKLPEKNSTESKRFLITRKNKPNWLKEKNLKELKNLSNREKVDLLLEKLQPKFSTKENTKKMFYFDISLQNKN